ncbi:hypothetical protein [Haloechinothrix alba]|nr:hypothetical protein [Haloechinothrix alba]
MESNEMSTQSRVRRGREFLEAHGRVLERRLAELHLDGGGPAVASAVLDAVASYRNPDGGLGHGLEPDAQDPASQPLAVDFGLEIVEQVLDAPGGRDAAVCERAGTLAAGVLPFLESVTAPGGGVPIVLPSVAAHPRAEHWGDGRFPAGLNPTAGIAARLRRAGVRGAWLDAAEEYCRREIDALDAAVDAHTVSNVLCFLDHHPDREWAPEWAPEWAQQCRATLLSRMGEWSLFHLYPGEGYGLSPLDLAATPAHPLRSAFPADAVAAHLDVLAAAQQEDGGWPLSWQPPGVAAELAWRGALTLRALRILTATP